MTYDLTPITDLVIARNQKLAMYGNFAEPRSWLEAGCDMQKDILPTMNRLMDKNLTISTFSYFTKAILCAKDTRIATEKALAAQEALKDDVGALRKKMERLAWLRKYSPGNFTRFKHELEEYEQQHGVIDLAG